MFFLVHTQIEDLINDEYLTWYDTSTEWTKHNFIIGLLTHCSGKLIKLLHDFIQNNTRLSRADSQSIEYIKKISL